jgi:5,6,7,8-tetrahydromethanopterin hydro-lyase
LRKRTLALSAAALTTAVVVGQRGNNVGDPRAVVGRLLGALKELLGGPPKISKIEDLADGKAAVRSLQVGESLVGEGNEVAHIDLLVGSKDGPVGQAFAKSLVNQKEGHTNLLAVVAPNLPAKPDTIISNKVTIKGEKQVGQMFGPAQAAISRAVVDAVREGIIPSAEVEDLCVVVGVFIHWAAADDKKIFDYNYAATKEALARALQGEPAVDTVLADANAARHPFAGGAEEDRPSTGDLPRDEQAPA